ncbi:UxaA family hydrolase [Megasphaera paucivorans]|uniref:Altronate dehydratase small subunit n=1 Tax=Megasphaera paucivorans TaxID=349095 RepID=A0A1H0BMZ3_9FIRM|nr:UxaA family hydrolase [Megasphaera paucivorans]SDN47047.1 altronate dehydratase small subunit [Megasphaera paucivorans]
MINAMIIDELDNVGVVIYPIKKGDTISYVMANQQTAEIQAVDDIKIYHKFAIRDIVKGAPVVKYGQHIGSAGIDIKQGQHVHIHNVESVREL